MRRHAAAEPADASLALPAAAAAVSGLSTSAQTLATAVARCPISQAWTGSPACRSVPPPLPSASAAATTAPTPALDWRLLASRRLNLAAAHGLSPPRRRLPGLQARGEGGQVGALLSERLIGAKRPVLVLLPGGLQARGGASGGLVLSKLAVLPLPTCCAGSPAAAPAAAAHGHACEGTSSNKMHRTALSFPLSCRPRPLRSAHLSSVQHKH